VKHYKFLVDWKRELMSKLDQDYLCEWDWKDFVETARQFGYPAMAADMENRLKHYQKQAERGA
jgi:hypothetical protein